MYVIKKLKILLHNIDELEKQGKSYPLGMLFTPLYPLPPFKAKQMSNPFGPGVTPLPTGYLTYCPEVSLSSSVLREH